MSHQISCHPTLSRFWEMQSKCPICLCSITIDDITSLPCGHIFCRPCLVRLMDSERVENPRRKSFKCPLCKCAFNDAKLTKLYPIAPSSSPPRRSPPLFQSADESDDETDIDRNQLWVKIEYKNAVLMKLVEGCLNYANAETIAKEVQGLGCLFGAAENTNLDLKIRINRFLSITHKLVTRQLLPALEQINRLKEENSELSDEVVELSESLDERDKVLVEEREKHRKQMSLLAQEQDKRVNELDSKAKLREAKHKDLRSNYNNLYKEHKQLKSEFEDFRRHCKGESDSIERYQRMLSDLKASNDKYVVQIAALKRNLSDVQLKLSQLQLGQSQEKAPQATAELIDEEVLIEEMVFPPTHAESIHMGDHRNEMSWATKRKPGLLLPSKPKPSKLPRTETKVGPLHLVNGKLSKAAALGSRGKGLN